MVAIARRSSNTPLRSAICTALGLMDSRQFLPEESKAVHEMLLEFYQNAPDGAVHSAAGGTLRRWNVDLPELPRSNCPAEGRDWYTNTLGATMLHVPDGEVVMREENDPTKFDTVSVRAFYIANQETTVEMFKLKSNCMELVDYGHSSVSARLVRVKSMDFDGCANGSHPS